MGQHLSEPVTTKDTSTISNERYHCCATSMQGWRINMEDAHQNILSMKDDKEAGYFSVFDGHGGSQAATYCAENLHKTILATEEYRLGNYAEALRLGFLHCDKEMSSDVKIETSGAAAVCILIKNKKIYCANCGDSRAIASVKGRAQELSFDHKPNDEEESRRIVAAGGWVEYNRVNGNLALSRAMGDFVFKRNSKKTAEEQIVTANPDIIEVDITPEHEFVLLACDGIWDVMSRQEVVDFVRVRLANKETPDKIVEKLLDHCLAPDSLMGGIGCDNMTAVLVCLLNEKSLESLAERCNIPAAVKTATEDESETVPPADDNVMMEEKKETSDEIEQT